MEDDAAHFLLAAVEAALGSLLRYTCTEVH